YATAALPRRLSQMRARVRTWPRWNYESGGQEFESLRARQPNQALLRFQEIGTRSRAITGLSRRPIPESDIDRARRLRREPAQRLLGSFPEFRGTQQCGAR